MTRPRLFHQPPLHGRFVVHSSRSASPPTLSRSGSISAVTGAAKRVRMERVHRHVHLLPDRFLLKRWCGEFFCRFHRESVLSRGGFSLQQWIVALISSGWRSRRRVTSELLHNRLETRMERLASAGGATRVENKFWRVELIQKSIHMWVLW